MEPRMDTKELEEAASERAEGTERKVEELRVESAALPPVDSAEPRKVSERDFGGSGRNAASPLGGESAGTQLALQDAEEALARTREERDALRAKVAELREEIEHLRNDVAWWRGEAKGQELLADALAKENAWLKAKVAVKERTEREKVEELRVESAALPPVDSAEPREVCAGGFRGSGRNAASPLGTEIDVVDMEDARCDAMALWAQRGSGRNAASPLGESAGTQLALQDAEEALAQTREERDALRAKVAELREEIRELEHEKHCEKLRADALAVSRTKWKASAEAMEEALCAAHAALSAARAVKDGKEKVEELRVESAAKPPVDSAEPRKVCAGGVRGSGRNAASPL